MKKPVFVVALGALLALATATEAWSQGTNQNSGAPNSPGTHAPSGTNSGSVGPGIATRTGPSGTFGEYQQQHPEWFSTKTPYRPCPSSVTIPNGRSACLGCPTPCRFHF
jgi:hypothetical protein